MHGASFLNRAWQLYCCTVITHLDTSKRSTQKAFSCCGAILETGPAVSMSERTAGSAWETWTVAAADGDGFARVRWEINFLLTFETVPFICKHPVQEHRLWENRHVLLNFVRLGAAQTKIKIRPAILNAHPRHQTQTAFFGTETCRRTYMIHTPRTKKSISKEPSKHSTGSMQSCEWHLCIIQ